MTRPRLLDLFCGAGGAGMGYHRAGFDVVGVDINPQPNYPFEFHQGDALTWPFDGYDAIHASPPCQHYANVTRWRGNPGDHPNLIVPIRARLHLTDVPWMMENVRTPQLRGAFVLCGSIFDLPIRRHRYFETSGWAGYQLMSPCRHRGTDLAFMHKAERAYADAMGCDWMTNREAREAIPPAYTQWIGEQLLAHLGQSVAS
jgi:DNA (cytosine-5)-methyltransferase 1